MALVLRKDRVEGELYVYDTETGQRIGGPYDNNQEALDALAEIVAQRVKHEQEKAREKDNKRRRH